MEGREDTVLRTTVDERQAEAWALTLASIGIACRLERGAEGFALAVEAEAREAAEAALVAYDAENPPAVPEPLAPERWSMAGTFIALFLIGFFGFVGGVRAERWYEAGTADAARLLGGQWWRAVTALTLHGDLAHVASNAVALAIIVGALGGRLGVGAASWLLLLGGAGGNVINALVHGGRHLSIGASTAVFAAVGLLGTLELVRRRLRGRRGAWLALAAALGLFAMLGTSKDTDVLAHLFGLGAGLVLELPAAALDGPRLGPIVQGLLALAAAAVVAGCWGLALGVL